MKLITLALTILVASQAFGQQAQTLKPHHPAYAGIVDIASKSKRNFRFGSSIELVRVMGDKAFVYDRLEPIRGDHNVYEFASTLRFVKGRWVKSRTVIGGGARALLARDLGGENSPLHYEQPKMPRTTILLHRP